MASSKQVAALLGPSLIAVSITESINLRWSDPNDRSGCRPASRSPSHRRVGSDIHAARDWNRAGFQCL